MTTLFLASFRLLLATQAVDNAQCALFRRLERTLYVESAGWQQAEDGPTDTRSQPRSSGMAAGFLRVANGTGNSLGMELDFALLAKGAETSEEGLVSLIGGGFDGIAVDKLPASIAPFAIVARYSAKAGEVEEEHTISFEIVSPSGEVTRVVDKSKIKFAPTDHEGRDSHATGVAVIGFRFDQSGKHQIRLFTDEHLAKTLDLYVVEQSKIKQAVL